MKLYSYFRIFSIDVALGACAMAFFFASVQKLNIPLAEYIVLGLSVWLIYTTDHLLDAYKISHSAHTQRHLFHQEHFEKIIIGACVVLGITTWLAFTQLSLVTIRYGIMVSGLVMVHFGLAMVQSLKKWLIFYKEVRISFVYVLGVSLPTFSKVHFWEMNYLILFVSVFILAFINLLLISFFEYESDKADHQNSMARTLGKKLTWQLIAFMFVLKLLWLILSMFFIAQWYYVVVLGMMALSLLLIYLNKNIFQQKEYYRILADAVFIYPLILYLF